MSLNPSTKNPACRRNRAWFDFAKQPNLFLGISSPFRFTTKSCFRNFHTFYENQITTFDAIAILFRNPLSVYPGNAEGIRKDREFRPHVQTWILNVPTDTLMLPARARIPPAAMLFLPSVIPSLPFLVLTLSYNTQKYKYVHNHRRT